jgi:YHS domain-containing protein
MASRRCSVCGQTVSKSGNSTLEASIDGTRYIFDTASCLAMFNKFLNVYGNSFVSELAVTA